MTINPQTGPALWQHLVQWQPADAAAIAAHCRALPDDWPLRVFGVGREEAALLLPPGATGEQFPDRTPEVAPYDEIAALDDCPACGEAEGNCRFHEGYAAGYHELAQAQRDAVKARPDITLQEFMHWQADVAEAEDRGEEPPVLPAVPVPPATHATERAALRDRIAEALDNAHHTHPCPVTGSQYWTGCHHPDGTSSSCHTNRRTAAVLAVLPPSADRAEPPLSPDYQHPECGFNWHGRDGMDIPMRDGEPVCPRCELARVEKLLAHRERRCEELRKESRRRGKTVLEYAEKIRVLESEIDEVRRQLGAEILRASQAEAEVERLRGDRAALLNAAAQHLYTALFPAVYDDMGQKAAEGVNRAVSELRRLADEAQQQCPEQEPLIGVQCSKRVGHDGAHSDRPGRIWYPAPDAEVQQQPDTETPFVPPAHYRGRDGAEFCVHTIPVGPDSCRECRDLDQSAVPARTAASDVLAEAVAALQAKAAELSTEAEEEMRRDLEEQAQVWHEAADMVRRVGRKAARRG